MANKKETAAPNVSVGADTEQPPNVNNNSITNYPPKNNSEALETVSMAELYDSVYPSKPPLIDGPWHLSFCRRAKSRQELSYSADCVPYQYGSATMGIFRPKRNGLVPCP